MPSGGAPSRIGAAPGALPDTRALLAKADRENFPVASRLLPRGTRDHLLAVYGFARLVDDVGDESEGDRPALLDFLDAEVGRAYARVPELPLMRRLVPTVRAFGIPPEPLRRLIAANRQDQTVHAYETFSDLVAYCELSANPVGHLVLHILRAATPERMALSDAVCTGLQLVEHWQDVAEDLRRGRIYLPGEDLRRFACTREDLRAPRASPELRRLMAFEAGRAAALLDHGVPLARSLGGRAGLAVAGFVAGGRAALAAIRQAGYDVLRSAPRAGRGLRSRWLARTLVDGWVRWT